MTLLEKAMAAPSKKRQGAPADFPEKVDLALAYLRGEITCKQVAVGLGVSRQNGQTYIVPILRKALEAKLIAVTVTGPSNKEAV